MNDIPDEEHLISGGNAPEFTVSELSGAVRRALEERFDRVRVRGEVGRVTRATSGHVYLDLKDDRAVLGCVVWKGAVARLGLRPEQGDEVIAEGRLTSFPQQSKYQLVIERMAYAGAGALLAKLERLKAALAAEGLFADARKRPLPYLPRVIGVVTSPVGAVIRDILHRLADRFPVRVLVWPVAVQGASCAAEVAAAVRGFDALPAGGPVPRPDLLIVARGGGSVEDLWGFNEEVVVRAVADCAIPVISAVGHETDVTLVDFAADRRAPTPTAAAEMAVPVRRELLAALAALEERRARALDRLLAERGRRLRDLARVLPAPDALLAAPRQRLDRAAERAPRALASLAQRRRLAFAAGGAGRFGPALLTAAQSARRATLRGSGDRLAPALRRSVAAAGVDQRRLAARLTPRRIREAQARAAGGLDAASRALDRLGAASLRAVAERLERAGRMLGALGYTATLARGYAVVRGAGDAPLTRAADVAPGARLAIEFHDGRVGAVAGALPGPKPKPARPRGGGGQGSLL